MTPAPAPSTSEADTPLPGARVPRPGRRLLIVALGPVLLGIFLLGTAFPWATEAAYASWLGPGLAWTLSAVSGLTTHSLVEPVVLAIVAWLGWRFVGELRNARARGRSRLWGLGSWLLTVAQTASVLVALFYLLWGFNYARPSLDARLGWDEVREVGADELATLAGQAITATNHAYRALHGADDAGVPTRMPPDPTNLERALDRGWASAAGDLELDPALGRSHGPVKTLAAPGLLSELGLLGFYFPYTAEAVVNGLAPAVILPRSMAHEQAHQRGIGPENEASFMAIMATVRAPDPLVRYAGFAAVQRRLLTDLASLDRERALQLARSRLPGVERDARDLDAFYETLQGPMNEVAERVNDAYLRHHRVEGGIRSYGLVTRLLVAYARSREGLLVSP